jgi:hypothetical protein
MNTNTTLTPEEQAKEILRIYGSIIDERVPPNVKEKDVKQCATIHINGIIENNPTNLSGVSTIEYWQAVKIEMRKL